MAIISINVLIRLFLREVGYFVDLGVPVLNVILLELELHLLLLIQIQCVPAKEVNEILVDVQFAVIDQCILSSISVKLKLVVVESPHLHNVQPR